MKEKECEEVDCHNARFGFALANAQDVDGDGYTGTTNHVYNYNYYCFSYISPDTSLVNGLI